MVSTTLSYILQAPKSRLSRLMKDECGIARSAFIKSRASATVHRWSVAPA